MMIREETKSARWLAIYAASLSDMVRAGAESTNRGANVFTNNDNINRAIMMDFMRAAEYIADLEERCSNEFELSR